MSHFLSSPLPSHPTPTPNPLPSLPSYLLHSHPSTTNHFSSYSPSSKNFPFNNSPPHAAFTSPLSLSQCPSSPSSSSMSPSPLSPLHLHQSQSHPHSNQSHLHSNIFTSSSPSPSFPPTISSSPVSPHHSPSPSLSSPYLTPFHLLSVAVSSSSSPPSPPTKSINNTENNVSTTNNQRVPSALAIRRRSVPIINNIPSNANHSISDSASAASSPPLRHFDSPPSPSSPTSPFPSHTLSSSSSPSLYDTLMDSLSIDLHDTIFPTLLFPHHHQNHNNNNNSPFNTLRHPYPYPPLYSTLPSTLSHPSSSPNSTSTSQPDSPILSGSEGGSGWQSRTVSRPQSHRGSLIFNNNHNININPNVHGINSNIINFSHHSHHHHCNNNIHNVNTPPIHSHLSGNILSVPLSGHLSPPHSHHSHHLSLSLSSSLSYHSRNNSSHEFPYNFPNNNIHNNNSHKMTLSSVLPSMLFEPPFFNSAPSSSSSSRMTSHRGSFAVVGTVEEEGKGKEEKKEERAVENIQSTISHLISLPLPSIASFSLSDSSDSLSHSLSSLSVPTDSPTTNFFDPQTSTPSISTSPSPSPSSSPHPSNDTDHSVSSYNTATSQVEFDPREPRKDFYLENRRKSMTETNSPTTGTEREETDLETRNENDRENDSFIGQEDTMERKERDGDDISEDETETENTDGDDVKVPNIHNMMTHPSSITLDSPNSPIYHVDNHSHSLPPVPLTPSVSYIEVPSSLRGEDSDGEPLDPREPQLLPPKMDPREPRKSISLPPSSLSMFMETLAVGNNGITSEEKTSPNDNNNPSEISVIHSQSYLYNLSITSHQHHNMHTNSQNHHGNMGINSVNTNNHLHSHGTQSMESSSLRLHSPRHSISTIFFDHPMSGGGILPPSPPKISSKDYDSLILSKGSEQFLSNLLGICFLRKWCEEEGRAEDGKIVEALAITQAIKAKMGKDNPHHHRHTNNIVRHPMPMDSNVNNENYLLSLQNDLFLCISSLSMSLGNEKENDTNVSGEREDDDDRGQDKKTKRDRDRENRETLNSFLHNSFPFLFSPLSSISSPSSPLHCFSPSPSLLSSLEFSLFDFCKSFLFPIFYHSQASATLWSELDERYEKMMAANMTMHESSKRTRTSHIRGFSYASTVPSHSQIIR